MNERQSESSPVRVAVFGSVAATPRRPRPAPVDRVLREQRRLERPRPRPRPARGVS